MSTSKTAARAKPVRRQLFASPSDKFADREEGKNEEDKSALESDRSSSEEEEQQDEAKDSDYQDSDVLKVEVTQEMRQAIVDLTKDFSLTYAQVKSSSGLKQPPLLSVP